MGWMVRGSNPWEGGIFRTCPDRPWGPPSLLYDGYWVFPGDKEQPGMTLTPHPLLVPWSLKGRAIPLPPYGPYSLYRAPVHVQGCTLTFFYYPQIQWALFTGAWSSCSIRLQLHSLTHLQLLPMSNLSLCLQDILFRLLLWTLKAYNLTHMNVWRHLYKTVQQSPINMGITFTHTKKTLPFANPKFPRPMSSRKTGGYKNCSHW